MTQEEEGPFRKLLEGERVVDWAFAPGSIPFAAAIVNFETYGEFRLFVRKDKQIQTLVTGKLKPEEIQLSRCNFILGGAHALVVVRESFQGASLSTVLIYDLARGESRPVFTLQSVYDLRYEPASVTELLLWQKDRSFYNQGPPPYKYNYFLLAYDTVQNRYIFDFLLRSLVALQPDEATALNNAAVQIYLQGDLKSADVKLEDAAMLAQFERDTILRNRRLLDDERKMLSNRSINPEGGTAALFDDVKLNYLLGEYDLVLMTLATDARIRSRGDRMALYGLCYARKRDYDDLQKITKALADNGYEYLTEYFEEVSRILFYNRNPQILKAYLKALEGRDPLNPTLAYLKAAVLADSGRLELAAQLLDGYLTQVNEDERCLGECREYLYEIATILGDTETAQRMLGRLAGDAVWNLVERARLANFNGFLHTDLAKASTHIQARIKAPERPLERFTMPDIPGAVLPPEVGED